LLTKNQFDLTPLSSSFDTFIVQFLRQKYDENIDSKMMKRRRRRNDVKNYEK
jgi:hypothetical protein